MAKRFINGDSTKYEVDRLMELGLKPGEAVSYEQVEQASGVAYGSNRWKAVTNRWRDRLMRESGLRVVCIDKTFRGLTAEEAVADGVDSLNGVGRKIARTHRRVGAVDTRELTERSLQQHTLLRRHTATLLATVQDAAKAVALPPAPTTSAAPLRIATREGARD